jgi:hypothetical protein
MDHFNAESPMYLGTTLAVGDEVENSGWRYVPSGGV